MKKGVLSSLGERARRLLRQALSPAFLLILAGSVVLWYTSKLGYDYTTEMPMNVRIDDQKYRLSAIVSGRGSTLVAWRMSLKSRLNISLDELTTSPAPDSLGGGVLIAPESLQKALSDRLTSLQVVEVIDAPPFKPEPEPEEPEDITSRTSQL